MTNEQEIEKMGKLLCDNYPQGCKDCWYDPCKDHEDSCAIESEVETLVSAGIGDKKQAVKEAFDMAKKRIKNNVKGAAHVPSQAGTFIKQAYKDLSIINELFTELYGDNNE